MTAFPIRARGRAAAFTLIEIMIVVLIIGILLGIAVPNFVRARESSRQKSCVSNLRMIDSAKQQWAMDARQGSTATPTQAALAGPNQYLRSFPSCPATGSYTIGNIDSDPTCNYARTIGGTTYDHKL